MINEHNVNTKNSGFLLKVPKMRLDLGKTSFFYAGTKLYNDLPLGIRKSQSVTAFRNKINDHFN